MHQVIPIELLEGKLTLATYKSINANVVYELNLLTECRVVIKLLEHNEWLNLYQGFLQSARMAQSYKETMLKDNITIKETTISHEVNEDDEVPRLVDAILEGAWNRDASDIHIEPERDGLIIRLRLDGLLHEYLKIPKDLSKAIVARFKLLAEMDLVEKRLSQDAHLHTMINNQEINLRIASLPVYHGEKLVLRFLRSDNIELSLSDLGMTDKVYDDMCHFLTQPNGLILITGPTGSGKTTTLYTAINHLKDTSINITSIEDPIEFELRGINQVSINPYLGFAAGLRGILRQDPDIIMIGEIRDRETAEIALRASITGRLVLSSIHTNDACGAIIRLLDMGLEPYLVASALTGVINQRLVRRLCSCRRLYKEIYEGKELIFSLDDEKKDVIANPKCPLCHGRGYVGRYGIFESLRLNSAMQKLILERTELERLRETAFDSGWRSILEDGFKKVSMNITDLPELRRVLSVKEDFHA